MPEDTPRIAERTGAVRDRAGFCDQVFEAYYGGGELADGAEPAAEPSAPRSRNSYMRTRARRLAAAAPQH